MYLNVKNSLKLNAILNVIKQICMIIFPMITFPYVSRVLGKNYYGKINFSNSIISYFILIAGLGITNYAIREGSRVKNDPKQLTKLCNEIFSINLISTFISYILLFLVIKIYKKLDDYTILLIIQSGAIIFTTIGTDWYNSIFEDFLYITIRYIVCQTLAIVLMFLLVKTHDDYIKYAFTSIIGGILANISNLFYIRNKYKQKIRFTFKLNLKKHLKPIMILFGTSIASLIYINSDVTILGILKNDTEVGLYSVSAKIYTLVKQVMNALLIVSLPRISNEIANVGLEKVNIHLNKILKYLLIIAIPSCVGLFMLSKNIIVLISGNEFVAATISLKILSISLLFSTLACFYVNTILIPFRMEKIALNATIISAATNIVLNVILIPYYGKDAAAFTTLISELIMVSVGIVSTRKLVRIHIGSELYISIISGILTYICCMTVSYLKLSIVNNIFISMLFSMIGCIILLYFTKRELFIYAVNVVKKNQNSKN